MKKNIIGTLLTIFLVAGCASLEHDAEPKKQVKSISENTVLKKDDLKKVFEKPDTYRGQTIEFYGKIVGEPEKDSEGVCCQMEAIH